MSQGTRRPDWTQPVDRRIERIEIRTGGCDNYESDIAMMRLFRPLDDFNRPIADLEFERGRPNNWAFPTDWDVPEWDLSAELVAP